jgi:hypothetical protein
VQKFGETIQQEQAHFVNKLINNEIMKWNGKIRVLEKHIKT